jgi:hypothetical protein
LGEWVIPKHSRAGRELCERGLEARRQAEEQPDFRPRSVPVQSRFKYPQHLIRATLEFVIHTHNLTPPALRMHNSPHRG